MGGEEEAIRTVETERVSGQEECQRDLGKRTRGKRAGHRVQAKRTEVEEAAIGTK